MVEQPHPRLPQSAGLPPQPTPIVTGSYYSTIDPDMNPVRMDRRRRLLLIGGIGLGALLLMLGGGAAWAVNAHGSYPYQHVGGGASGYVQLNMSPSLLQKLQVASFLGKLPRGKGADPTTQVTSNTTVAQAILKAVAPSNSVQDYSWAGQRYGFVAYGPVTSWSSPDSGVLVMETNDATKAVTALNAGLPNGLTTSDRAQALDGNYVAVGTPAGLKAASNTASHLTDDPMFRQNYTGAGDPVSYWVENGAAVSTGSLRADWGSLKLTGRAVGDTTLNIAGQLQAQNRDITAGNSLSDPILNLGLVQPKQLFGSATPFGQALLARIGSYAASANLQVTKQTLDTTLDALGDNVSVSVNKDNVRILLHGTSATRLNGDLSKLAGQKVTVQQLLKASDPNRVRELKYTTDANGALFAYGPNPTAAPLAPGSITPGILVARMDLDRLPTVISSDMYGKLGTISLAVTGVGAGTETTATWQLP